MLPTPPPSRSHQLALVCQGPLRLSREIQSLVTGSRESRCMPWLGQKIFRAAWRKWGLGDGLGWIEGWAKTVDIPKWGKKNDESQFAQPLGDCQLGWQLKNLQVLQITPRAGYGKANEQSIPAPPGKRHCVTDPPNGNTTRTIYSVAKISTLGPS